MILWTSSQTALCAGRCPICFLSNGTLQLSQLHPPLLLRLLFMHCTGIISLAALNIVLEYCTGILYSNIVLEYCTVIVYCNIVLQYCTGIISLSGLNMPNWPHPNPPSPSQQALAWQKVLETWKNKLQATSQTKVHNFHPRYMIIQPFNQLFGSVSDSVFVKLNQNIEKYWDV